MSLSQLEIINAALIKLGGYKITSMTDGSTESDIAATLYTPVRDSILSQYPWGFATHQILLSTPTTAPISDYTYAFNVPTDHLRTLSVSRVGADCALNYRFNGNRIETDESIIILTYIKRVNESMQPSFFDAVLIARLAAEFCLPLTENTSRAEILYRLSEQEMSRARSIDAQQDSPSRIRRYTLIDARGV